MEDAKTGRPRAAAGVRAHWEEPAWREQIYSLTLLPDAEDGERLARMASGLKAGDGWSLAPSPVPDITLATFTAREAMEETLTRWIQRICRDLKRFRLGLGEPAVFPDRSLRMRVTDASSLQKPVERLQVLESYIRSCGTGGMEWVRNPTCRLGIAVPAGVGSQTFHLPSPEPLRGVFPVHLLLLEKRGHPQDEREKVYLCPLPS